MLQKIENGQLATVSHSGCSRGGGGRSQTSSIGRRGPHTYSPQEGEGAVTDISSHRRGRGRSRTYSPHEGEGRSRTYSPQEGEGAVTDI